MLKQGSNLIAIKWSIYEYDEVYWAIKYHLALIENEVKLYFTICMDNDNIVKNVGRERIHLI